MNRTPATRAFRTVTALTIGAAFPSVAHADDKVRTPVEVPAPPLEGSATAPRDGTTAPAAPREGTEMQAPPAAHASTQRTGDASKPLASGHLGAVGSPASAPPPPGSFGVLSRVPARLYGIIHTAALVTRPVDTFGQSNASAVTSAANPALSTGNDGPLLTFQAQQTRLGVVVGEGTSVRGQAEVDFIHFDQASPTTQAFPRLRIGVVEWEPSPGHTLFFGQTWDVFGNAAGPQLLSHSANLVGTLFRAGNIGFQRHQLGYRGRVGRLEVGTALGLQGNNAGPTFSNLERSATPTGSARFMVHLGDLGVVGVSGIASSLRLTDSSGIAERRFAVGGEVFGDVNLGPLNVHSEAYLAQNLANLGALNLGQARFGTSVSDVGGYVSGRLKLGSHHAITAMVGVAAVLNPGDVVPSYTPASVDSTTGTPIGALALQTAGPGITRNVTAHVGYSLLPVPWLSITAEPYVYATEFALAKTDEGRVSGSATAVGGMLVSMVQF